MSGIKYEVLAGDDLISALRGGRTGDLLDDAAYAAADEIERLQRVLQKVMVRCADLLDEDHFNELDAMVMTGQPRTLTANIVADLRAVDNDAGLAQIYLRHLCLRSADEIELMRGLLREAQTYGIPAELYLRIDEAICTTVTVSERQP